MFTLLGMSVLLISVSLLNLPKFVKKRKSNPNLRDEIKDGWKSLVENKPLWILTIIICICNIAATISFAVFVFYALDYYNLNEKELGIVFLFSGALG
jgi:Na+/melibiose symporter-like transporter